MEMSTNRDGGQDGKNDGRERLRLSLLKSRDCLARKFLQRDLAEMMGRSTDRIGPIWVQPMETKRGIRTELNY